MSTKQLNIFTGKRKTANARVRIKSGSGSILVNGRNYNEYFAGRQTLINVVEAALKVTGNLGKYDILVNVFGGGVSAQADAIRHGISKALLLESDDYKATLKRNGFLTRDPRVVERKKYGRAGARRRFQFSKR